MKFGILYNEQNPHKGQSDNMLYEILIIFVCMFAALGIVELAVYTFNRLCSSRLPHKFYIVADNFSAEDAEYVIRFLESLIGRGGLGSAICGIRLGKNAQIDRELLLALLEEFPNIEQME